MSGSPKKPTQLRQGHGAATRDIELSKEQPPTPLPPSGLLARSKQIWAAYWKAPVARAVDLEADGHLLERWIRAVDEYERVLPQFKKERVTTGSTGQLVIHPLAGYLAQVKTELKSCEAELGLTPMARLRLGIATGEAQLTAMELNRRLNESAQGDALPGEVWEGDWTEA